MDKTNKESYIPKVLALVSFCTVFGLILVSVITDLVIFKDFILNFIGGMIITGVVFIILFIGFVLSILLVFGVGIVKDSGFWPLSISISLSKEILDDVFKSKKPFTFRAGTKVYENYIFTSFIPAENFEESLNFSAEIKKIDVGSILIQKVNIPKSSSSISGQQPNQKVIKKNTSSQTGNSSKSIQNKTTPKKIYGIGRFFNIDQGVDDLVKKLNSWKGNN